MSKINITIDAVPLTGETGDTILKIASDNGIFIPTLCHSDSLKHYGACSICLVEAENNPKLLRACSTAAADGMAVHTDTDRVLRARKISMELLMSDHEGDCLGPCSLNCPAGTDCQGYVKQIALGNDREAVRIIKEKLPFPSSIGRVCPHPCETACRRQHVEESISIAFLKAFAADRDRASGNPFTAEKDAPTGKRVTVLGGGPAGLTAAYFLALKGHDVEVIEQMPEMGGMLRYGIPEYRLPKRILDAEISDIEKLGVKMTNGVKIGRDISFEQIKENCDAVVVAIGAWKSMGVGCPGEELNGVLGGIDFLRDVSTGGNPDIGKKVAVIGGGNTAMDACRTAVRLGAEKVYVVYRRTEAEMPAEQLEIDEAREEGVIFKFLCSPAEITGEGGKVGQLKLQVMQLGEPDASGRRSPTPVEGSFEYLEVDSVIAAIGQKVNVSGFDRLELNHRGIITADETSFRTCVPGVFAVGDATNRGAGIAIEAIGEANRAAGVIHAYLLGQDVPYRKPFVSERAVTPDMFADRWKLPRAKMACRPAAERKHDFNEITLGFTEEQARREAERCLECGCHDYSDCKLIQCANMLPIDPDRMKGEKHPSFVETRLVSIERNQGKCITCSLCVRTCDEIAGKGLLGLVGRGFTTVIKPEFEDSADIAGCKDCLKCAEACPTGALKIIR